MKWVNIEDRKPEYGVKVIVFRGKTLISHAYKFDFPDLVEYTNKYDNLITHWMPLDPPIHQWPERLNPETSKEDAKV